MTLERLGYGKARFCESSTTPGSLHEFYWESIDMILKNDSEERTFVWICSSFEQGEQHNF